MDTSRKTTKKRTHLRKSTTDPVPRPNVAYKRRISQEERQQAIEEMAYFLAEKDGFSRPPVEYWCKAEKQSGQGEK